MLKTYGSPCLTPHSRSPRPAISRSARPDHAQRRGSRSGGRVDRVSAVGIDRVVAAGVDPVEVGERNLIARIIAHVDDRLDEHGAAERVDGHAAAPYPVP